MAHLLVVDDDPDLRDAVRDALQSCLERHAVRTAASGEEALEALRLETFDLLLTDQRLPGITGLELAAQAESACPGLSTVLMTSYGWDTVMGLGDAMGDRSILQKPFGLGALLEEVRLALTRPRPWLVA